MDTNDSKDFKALTDLYELCIKTRNFEIMQLVNRNNFFMIFQGVLLAGVIQSTGTIPVVSFLGCLCGLLISLLQTGMASGAKYWQEHWETSTVIAEREIINQISLDKDRNTIYGVFSMTADEVHEQVRNRLFERNSGPLISHLILKKYSVSKIPIYVGIVFSITWLSLLFCTMSFGWCLHIPSFIVGF